MKRIAWITLSCFMLVTASFGDTTTPGEDTPTDQLNEAASYELKTPYGLVQVDEGRRTIFVDGKAVFTSNSDAILVKEDFKLRNEIAILFDDANTGSGGIPSAVYFLILKPNMVPTILTTQGFEVVGGIERAWQENDAVYVSLGYKTIATLKSDKIKITSQKYPVDQDACAAIYDLSNKYCNEEKPSNVSCSELASQDPSVMPARSSGLSHGEMTGINVLMREHPGFNRKVWQNNCASLCNGKKVPFDKFKHGVCSIK